MFENILINRNKKLNQLLQLTQVLGRSLRENIELFKFNDELDKVYFVTENKKIISGVLKGNKLTSIEIEDLSTYLDKNKFDKLVETKISGLIGSLYQDKYNNANKNLSEVLDLWNERIKLDKVSKTLTRKASNVSENKNILKSPETKNLIEILPSLVKFLKENKDKVSTISEIKNGVMLSNTIATAFGLPKISYKKLLEDKKYEFTEDHNTKTIFDLITRQELIKKELIESKNNFNSIWISNEHIKKLAEAALQKEDKVQEALSEAFCDVPYVAFLSKKQLTEIFNTLLNSAGETVPFKDIQEYSSYVFELKKPLRAELIKTLDEKYGINISNLKEPATFKSLINTQTVIFETICKVLPKNSPQKQVIKEFIKLLKDKDGIEAIDVNSIINKLFVESGYSLVTEGFMHRYLDFDALANELGNVSNILKMIRGQGGAMGGGMGQDPMQGGGQPGMGNTPAIPPQPQGMPPMGQPGMQKPMGGGNPLNPAAQPKIQSPALGGGKPPMGNAPLGGAPEEDTNSLTPDDAEGGIENGGQPGMGQPGMGGAPPTEMGQGQLMAAMAELEQILGNLKMELGEDPMGGMGDEEGMEQMPQGDPSMEGDPDEGGFGGEEDEDEEGGDINIDTGGGDDEIHVDKTKGTHDIENDDAADEETDTKPKGKGGFPPKKGGDSKGKPEKKDKKPFKGGK